MSKPSSPNSVPIASARADLDTIFEPQDRISIGQWTDFLNAVDAYYCASMCPSESRRIQLGRELFCSSAHEVCARTGVQRQIVALRFDPVYVVERHDTCPPTVFDGDLGQVMLPWRVRLECGRKQPFQLTDDSKHKDDEDE